MIFDEKFVKLDKIVWGGVWGKFNLIKIRYFWFIYEDCYIKIFVSGLNDLILISLIIMLIYESKNNIFIGFLLFYCVYCIIYMNY